VSRALWAGAIAGAVVGAGDAIAGWGRLGQFVPGLGGKLRVVLFASALAAATVAIAAAIVSAVVLVFDRATVLGPMIRGARARHDERRARDPRDALAGTAIAIASGPILCLAIYVAWRIGLHTITFRHHKGLITTVTVAATILSLGGAALVTLLAGKAVELLLRLLGREAARLLSSRRAPWIVLASIVALGAAIAAIVSRKVLAQLPLRPYVVAAIVVVATIAARPLATRALLRIRRIRRAVVRDLAHPGLVAIALIVAFLAGASPEVRKAALAYTGLSAPIVRALQAAVDLDRDGYSPLLGGGDCDDLDGAVHPGAPDAPDDGIDQNCLGGDVKLRGSFEERRFVELPPSVPRDANVLLVTIDTLRADHVGAYGYDRPTTPVLDALAAEGTLFANAWAHAPSTRYSMPAILTGRWPSQVFWDTSVWWPALRPENRTIAEVLKDRGFTTGALLNYDYFDKKRRMDQGFDVYRNEHARLHRFGPNRDPASTRGSSSREQADAAIAFLDEHAASRFFLWVHFYDPHFEYERHPGTHDFGGGKIDLYDHEIRFTDDQIARVIARVKELGLWDKTIVVVTGDHGEGFGEHGIDFHGYHLYAPQTKVPLVIRVPGVAARKVTTPVSHVDVLPTIANLVGAPAEEGMLGRSFAGEIAGVEGADGTADRPIFQEVSFEGPTERRGLVTQRWHLLYNMVPDNTWELYDLVADPKETRDVSAEHDVGDLKGRLLAWIDRTQIPPDAQAKLAGAILPGPPSPGHATDVQLGDAVRLVGWDVDPGAPRPGDELTLTLYFQALRPLDGPWAIFVHIEGPRRIVADHDPVGGALPLSKWTKGQFIADRHTVRIPPGTPPGEYAIHTGWWRRGKGDRLPATVRSGATAADDRVRLGTIPVAR
jgi:arylsulfatase A-like enzyme